MMVHEEGENVTKHLRSDICTDPAKSTVICKSHAKILVFTCKRVSAEKTLSDSIQF